MTDTDLQNTTENIKHRATQTEPHKKCRCFTNNIRCVTLDTHTVISHA